MQIIKSFENRRSIYSLGNRQVLSQDEISELIKKTTENAPSAFNSQSGRIVILYGKAYHKMWDITLQALSKVTPPEKINSTIAKINSFKKGLGTILFFEDTSVIAALQRKFPLYAESFPIWSEQSSGMLQYMVWLALSENKIGATVQHYSPLIEEDIKTQFNLPNDWHLVSQMPFGSIEATPCIKKINPIYTRVKIFN